jgi:hypothetical protein
MVSAGTRSVTDFQEKNMIREAVYYDRLLVVEGTSKEERQENRSEYSCAMKSHFRKSGNQKTGRRKSSYASLLA